MEANITMIAKPIAASRLLKKILAGPS